MEEHLALQSLVPYKGNCVLQIGALISELNDLLADTDVDVSCHDSLVTKLSGANLAVFQFLPIAVRQQLLLDRDPHGNVQVCARPGFSHSCI